MIEEEIEEISITNENEIQSIGNIDASDINENELKRNSDSIFVIDLLDIDVKDSNKNDKCKVV